MLSGADRGGGEAVTVANEGMGEGVPADVDMNNSTALNLSIFAFGKDLGGDELDDRSLTPAKTPEVHGDDGEANGVHEKVNDLDGEVNGLDGEVNALDGVANGVNGNSPYASLFNFPVYIQGLSESSGGPSLTHREP